MKIYTNFSIPYEKQSKEIKATFCKIDYEAIQNLLNFKKEFKKRLTSKRKNDIMFLQGKAKEAPKAQGAAVRPI